MPKRQIKKPGSTLPAHLRGPLRQLHFGPLNTQPSEAELDARRERRKILIERLEQLAKHFGIRGPHRWFLLSVELAKELGLFEEPEKRGVRRSVTDDEQRELVEKVDAINAERGRGIEDAVQILQQREPKYRKTERDAKSMKSKAKNPLATRYYEAAKKFKPPSWSLWGGHLRKKSTTKD